ncbi:MAG: family 43 glycosylhydrolase, partial [Bauldia litoralis]
MRMFGFKPVDGAAAGDTMPFFWRGQWHVFYLKPPVGSWGFPERTRNDLGHLVSDDLVDWQVLPDAFGPGAPGSPDADGIWTGSLIEHEGTFHFFYTGYNRDHPNQQRICHATSTDLVTWTKDPSNPLFAADPSWYEPIDWRDPFVYRDEATGQFRMLIAARENEGPMLRRGCIALATSDNLEVWTIHPPLWRPRLTHVMECPELFTLGGWWYLVFSRYSEDAQTIYRVSRTQNGPWEGRPLDSLDGRRFYAAKSGSDGHRRVTFAWTHERTGNAGNADWEWGGQFGSPRELDSLPDGTLTCRLPQALVATRGTATKALVDGKWGDWQQRDGTIRCNAVGTYGYAFLDHDRRKMWLETVLEIAAGTHSAGFLIETDDDLTKGHAIAVEPLARRVTLSKWPRAMDPLWQRLAPGEIANPTVDTPLVVRPLAVVPSDNRFLVRLLRAGSMIECFVGDQVV